MLLCGLPVELQLHIAKSLGKKDIQSLLLCSRKAYTSFLPALYRCIDFSVFPVSSVNIHGVPSFDHIPIDGILQRFMAGLQRHPERCSWVSGASFVWSAKDLDQAKKVRSNMLEVFGFLPSLQRLVMRQINNSEFYESMPQDLDGGNDLFVASRVLSQMPASKTMRYLVFEDSGTRLKDIYRLLCLPALCCLTVMNFHDKYQLLSSPDSEVDYQFPAIPAPASNIRRLSFLRSCPPSGNERYSRLFALQRHLELLIWEVYTMELVRGGDIGDCLYPLRNNLNELHLIRYWDDRMHGPAENQMIHFENFSALKILDIHNHFLFAGVPKPRSIVHQGWTSFHTLDLRLSERLPVSLESLKVSLLVW